MAAPGADRREFTDGHQTERANAVASARPDRCGSSPVFNFNDPRRFAGVGAAGTEPFADNTGKHGVQVLNGIAETDENAVSGPPAIEVVTGAAIVTERSSEAVGPTSDGSFGENGIYLRYLEPEPDRPRRAVIVE